KAAIACRRFRGRHTYNAIATELEDIFSKYGLTNDKVTACVMDNGSNFVKAFKEHQQRQMIMPGTGYVAAAKCSALWTKASRSTVASEFLEE
ncbi:Inorganic pyrophosphatase, partial [Dissostichus eleginoides]